MGDVADVIGGALEVLAVDPNVEAVNVCSHLVTPGSEKRRPVACAAHPRRGFLCFECAEEHVGTHEPVCAVCAGNDDVEDAWTSFEVEAAPVETPSGVDVDPHRRGLARVSGVPDVRGGAGGRAVTLRPVSEYEAKVVAVLRACGWRWLTTNDVARKTGVKRRTVKHHLGRWIDAGIVDAIEAAQLDGYYVPAETRLYRWCAHDEHPAAVELRERFRRAGIEWPPLEGPPTTCKRGHRLDGENAYVWPDLSVSCIACGEVLPARST